MSGFISICIDHVLDQIDDEELLAEMKRRDLDLETVNDLDDVAAAHRELLTGRPSEALAILDRILNPKWPTSERCLEQYRKALRSAA